MRGPKHKLSGILILLLALLALLPILAALQYHWLGQVSDAASQRIQTNLHANAIRFRQDFNRELIRAYLTFHMDSLVPASSIEQYHVDRLEQWTRNAPYRQLISDVLMVSYDDKGHARLSRLNQDAKRFEMIDWSGELATYRDGFERQQISTRSSALNSIESFAAEIPALIIPFPPSPVPESTSGTPTPAGFTVVTLNLNYLKAEFIPSLIERDLFDSSQNEYSLTMVSLRHPEKIIYSQGEPLINFSTADLSTRIFGFEPDELRTFLRSEWPSTTTGDQSTVRPLRLINLRYLKGSAAGLAKSAGEDDDGHWQLFIKHRAGSLATAVSSTRYRNLAISFGILLLLGVGIVMTAIATKRAERLAQEQINFVAGVSHELRTPLAVICSAGENLADGLVESREKVAQYGEVIYKEGRRLTEMVEQVLEFAGARAERNSYDLQPIAPADVINEALAACRTQIEEMGFTVEITIEPDLPLFRGDALALKRTLQNLISNSIKYDGKNRWACVRAQQSVGKQGDEIQITVQDRGPGISAADMDHIFEPFYRGQEAIAAQIKGSGLGLSLVKQIVEAHGGTISVKSTPDSGTSFTLHLPSLPKRVEAG